MMIRQLTRGGAEQLAKWQAISGRIAVIASKDAVKHANARLALAMTVNTLCRVHPVVTSLDVLVPDADDLQMSAPLFDGHGLKNGLASFIGKLKPLTDARAVDRLDGDYDAVLSIGNADIEHESKVCVASDGWIAHAGSDNLGTSFTDNFNPVGAHMAANIGSAEVFKRVFVKKADLIIPERSDYDFRWNISLLDKELKFNTFDYSVDSRNGPNPALPKAVDVGELMVAGVGAGGGSCLYTLASLPELEGTFHLIDPDEVKPSNLNRYIYAIHEDAEKERPKVNVIERLLSSSRTRIHTYHMPYTKFAELLNGKPIGLMVSTVDTSQTRIDIQWDLPRVLFDAAVAGTWFYLKRVELVGTACLGCMHYGKESSESVENLLSAVIGLPADVLTKLRNNNMPIEESHIELMRPFSEKHGFGLPKLGEHFQDWYLYHCGQIPLDGRKEIQIPVPFATVMPGILLAGEVIKQRHFCYYPVRDYFSYNIFGKPLDMVETLSKREGCPICSDGKILNRYREKHGI